MRQRGPRIACSSSGGWTTGWTSRWGSEGLSCREASGSGWRSHGRCSSSRVSCCATRRLQRWTRKDEKKVQEALDRELVAHRLSTIRDASVMYVFDSGEVKEVGTHESLCEKGEAGWYFKLLQRQQLGDEAKGRAQGGGMLGDGGTQSWSAPGRQAPVSRPGGSQRRGRSHHAGRGLKQPLPRM
jgi:hypothetical protein